MLRGGSALLYSGDALSFTFSRSHVHERDDSIQRQLCFSERHQQQLHDHVYTLNMLLLSELKMEFSI